MTYADNARIFLSFTLLHDVQAASEVRAADITTDDATHSANAEWLPVDLSEADKRRQGLQLWGTRASNLTGENSTLASGVSDVTKDHRQDEADGGFSGKIVGSPGREAADKVEQSDIAQTVGYETEKHAKEVLPSSPLLVALLSSALFIFVGGESGYGAWIAVVVLQGYDCSEANAARIASLFWGGITLGRLLAIPVTAHYDSNALLEGSLICSVASSALLLLMGRAALGWVIVCTGLYGLSTASIFPLAMSLPTTWGYTLSDKDVSKMVVSSAFGDMIVPWLIAWLLGSQGWPGILYVVSVVVSLLVSAFFVAARKAAERR